MENKKRKKSSFFNMPEWWEEYWQDMPEFIQEDQSPFKSIIVHFENKEDIKEFSELVEQKITSKTKSIWYPKAKIDSIMGKKYIDAEKERLKKIKIKKGIIKTKNAT